MIDLIVELVKLIADGIQSAERADDAATAKEHEITALRLAERRIQTEIAKRTLPPG
jgi:hypothetical protein